MTIDDWLQKASTDGHTWYLKRLSANDTGQNNTHQAGPYIPKAVAFMLFPSLNRPAARNPDCCFTLSIDSLTLHRTLARIVWYNNKHHGNPRDGRDEVRVTRLGGRNSALLDVDNTGALAILAFHRGESDTDANECRAWVCSHQDEDVVEGRWGPVEPGHPRIINFGSLVDLTLRDAPCWLAPEDMPPSWLAKFPSGAEIISKAISMRPAPTANPDQRLMDRRKCEFEIFQSLEEAIELPTVQGGFSQLSEFLQKANTILQRRKARAGLSLELHTRTILKEEGLKEGKHFSYQTASEPGKRPDFLFPNTAAYRDRSFPSGRLRMLAVKTTCRDRWRQVLNEADRIPNKHLLTLQEGVSLAQFQEMKDAGIKLVAPASLRRKYHKAIRREVIDLAMFIRDVKTA